MLLVQKNPLPIESRSKSGWHAELYVDVSGDRTEHIEVAQST